jgi:hypothetical protein
VKAGAGGTDGFAESLVVGKLQHTGDAQRDVLVGEAAEPGEQVRPARGVEPTTGKLAGLRREISRGERL